MAVTDMFGQSAVIEYLVKEGTRQVSSTRDFMVCMGMPVCMPAVSERGRNI